MLPLLGFHALAATRGEGLRPELLALLERLAEAAEPVANGPASPRTAPVNPSRCDRADDGPVDTLGAAQATAVQVGQRQGALIEGFSLHAGTHRTKGRPSSYAFGSQEEATIGRDK